MNRRSLLRRVVAVTRYFATSNNNIYYLPDNRKRKLYFPSATVTKYFDCVRTMNFTVFDNDTEKKAKFLYYYPVIAWRYDYGQHFVDSMDSWLECIAQSSIMDTKTFRRPEALPVLLWSLMRLHQYCAIISTDYNENSWSDFLGRKKFLFLIDHMTKIGFDKCHPDDIILTCQALNYFRDILRMSGKTSNFSPSENWLHELMEWICAHLKRVPASKMAPSTGLVLLTTLARFDENLKSDKHDLVLKILAQISKDKLRDFLAEKRDVKPRLAYQTLLEPRLMDEFARVWLRWRLDPDDSDLAPGTWRVWFETLKVLGDDYAKIGRVKNEYVAQRASVFSRLTVDMLRVARRYHAETTFSSTGAKGVWEQWALLTSFCCEPPVAGWMLDEIQCVEYVCRREKHVGAVLPHEFIRPTLRKHLEYLANRVTRG